jgi:carbamate kinase
MKIVIALGGNALLTREESLSSENLLKNCRLAAQLLKPVAMEYDLILAHGNGPQVGLLALETEAYKAVKPYPFDILVAQSQGMIGYLLQQQLGNVLIEKKVVTVLTQVIVSKDDPAFEAPTKPIGPVYTAQQVDELEQKNTWAFKEDRHGFRRVIASPTPQKIVELESISTLFSAGHLVITVGGGGIPCVKEAEGKLIGVTAVIDKDLSASLLAIELKAAHFIILTDVDGVYMDWNTPKEKLIQTINVEHLQQLTFAEGTMQPKVIAACDYVKKTGCSASIGKLQDLSMILQHKKGTLVVP